MNKYKIKLTGKEIKQIYNISECKNKQSKLMSVLAYLKKYSNGEKIIYSTNRLFTMYKRYHKEISRCYFFKLVKELKDIFFNKKVDIKVDKINSNETIETTTLIREKEKPNNITIDKYTNTINKSELVDIAKDLFDKLRINDLLVKTVVINKIKHSKVKINPAGAINYIKKVIYDKLVETTQEFYYEQQSELKFLNFI